jgi:hypothetical protein
VLLLSGRMRHKPGTDDEPILEFDSVPAQGRPAIFAYLPKLAKKAGDNDHVKRPKDDQPAVVRGFDIEVADG